LQVCSLRSGPTPPSPDRLPFQQQGVVRHPCAVPFPQVVFTSSSEPSLLICASLCFPLLSINGVLGFSLVSPFPLFFFFFLLFTFIATGNIPARFFWCVLIPLSSPFLYHLLLNWLKARTKFPPLLLSSVFSLHCYIKDSHDTTLVFR